MSKQRNEIRSKCAGASQRTRTSHPQTLIPLSESRLIKGCELTSVHIITSAQCYGTCGGGGPVWDSPPVSSGSLQTKSQISVSFRGCWLRFLVNYLTVKYSKQYQRWRNGPKTSNSSLFPSWWTQNSSCVPHRTLESDNDVGCRVCLVYAKDRQRRRRWWHFGTTLPMSTLVCHKRSSLQ